MCGDEHGTKPLLADAPESRHSNVDGDWLDENVNVWALTSLGSSGVVRSVTSGLTTWSQV